MTAICSYSQLVVALQKNQIWYFLLSSSRLLLVAFGVVSGMERLHGQLSRSHEWNVYPVWQMWCNSILAVENPLSPGKNWEVQWPLSALTPLPSNSWKAEREERKAQLSLIGTDLWRPAWSSSWMNESGVRQAPLAACSALPRPSTWERGLADPWDNHRGSVVLLWKPNSCPCLRLRQVNPPAWDSRRAPRALRCH